MSAAVDFKRYRAVAALACCAVIALTHSLFSATTSVAVESFETASNLTMKAEDIDPEEYYVFDDACLERTGRHNWTIRVVEPLQGIPSEVTFRVFNGGSDFVFHKFRVVQEAQLTITGAFARRRKGAYMLQANTHAYNNFHIIDDLLLLAFRAWRKAGTTGLLIPEGCAECWRLRLPLQSMLLDMMNLSVVYPLESAITNDAPMCFDRLIFQHFEEQPYYTRKGRFSRFWPRALFADFRDSAHAYFRRLLEDEALRAGDASEENGSNNFAPAMGNQGSPRKDPPGSSTGEAPVSNRTNPVLSWMSRSAKNGSCAGRCVTNEKDAVAQLSKYFHVNVLDFSAGLTTEQAMAYIMETDVLIGLHGAGLAYIAFLPDRAMVVELRGGYGNRFFINMASSMNVPYYSMSLSGCVGPGEDDVYTLPVSTVLDMTEEIHSAFREEEILFAQGQPEPSGRCDIPQQIEPCGHLSSTNVSRCYLHPWQDGWWQCPFYHIYC